MRAFLFRYGNVKATPFAAYKLLKEGEDVLLFPGGAREVVKRKVGLLSTRLFDLLQRCGQAQYALVSD